MKELAGSHESKMTEEGHRGRKPTVKGQQKRNPAGGEEELVAKEGLAGSINTTGRIRRLTK